MLEFSILQAYGKVITLKHETVLKNNLLENYILENYILFVICCIVKLQGHERLKKTQISCTAGCPMSLFAP